MKQLTLLLLCLPLILAAQDDAPDLVFENVILTPESDNVAEFEAAMAAHNKKFHADATYGCRVYYIGTGPNTGKYVWNMGPVTWGALDNRPSDEGHDSDWLEVVKHCDEEAYGTYWEFDTDNSNFQADFDLKNLYIMYFDVKRGKGKDAGYLLSNIKEVQAAHFANDPFGVYWNVTPSKGNEVGDLAVIWFFDKWAWMGEDSNFSEKFNEVHGDGAWERWLDDWYEVTSDSGIELWTLREDLSGIGATVPATERQ